ncbi:MAG: SusD/RagB family nutrient-binding outer membrane lipoprotein [Prevotellaceae bacterium]|nr:SusD/RagB family nutrient-binding outer membrane lipoprotein [Prevotellaceae bacterium]
MKKILTIALSSLVLLSACDMDINDNPNYASGDDVTTSMIFPAAENFIADCVGDDIFNYAGFFAQYFEQMPTTNQYNDIAELNLNESKSLFDRDYIYLYAGALTDLKEIINRSENTADIFACTVLRAYAFQVLVDNMSDAPYTEALQGSSNPAPKWDNGQAIYEGVLAELDEAEAKLETSDVFSLTDPMLNQDIEQWQGFANAIRLRMLLRLIDGNIKVAENTAKVKALVAEGNFFSGDIKWDVYSNAEGQYSPWFDAKNSLNASNHCAAYPIVEYFKATDDPRINYAILPCVYDGSFVGQFPGAKTVEAGWLGIATKEYDNDRVSNINYDAFRAAPIYLYTQSELLFLIAEVELRFNGNDAAAKEAYEDAVQTDFISKNAGSASAFLAGNLVSWTGTDAEKLNRIYMQKWVALFMRDHMEAWTEARRTDVPAVSSLSGKEIFENPERYNVGDFIAPAINYYGNGGVALRVPYPSNARQLNKNTPAAKNVSDRVFWDIK